MAVAVTFGTTACDKQGNAKITENLNTKMTPANVAKMQKGMIARRSWRCSASRPTTGEVENFDVIFKKQTVTYIEGKESLSVTYKNDEVEEFKQHRGRDNFHHDHRRPDHHHDGDHEGTVAANRNCPPATRLPPMEIPAELEQKIDEAITPLPGVQAERPCCRCCIWCRSISAM